MTTFGNKIQVSDPTDTCFLFIDPNRGDVLLQHSETIRSHSKSIIHEKANRISDC